MKKQFSFKKCIAVLSTVAFLSAASTVSAATVYDNSTTDLNTRFNPGLIEVGDEIVLGGTERILTSFRFQYWLENAGAGEDARIRFYANDGTNSPAGPQVPFSLLFDSDWFPIAATTRDTLEFTDFVTGALVPLSGAVPDSFTWSIQFKDLGVGATAGVDLYDPPTTGGNYNEYWDNTGAGGWEYRGTNSPNINFAARVGAVPEPGVLALGLCAGLGLLLARGRFQRR